MPSTPTHASTRPALTDSDTARPTPTAGDVQWGVSMVAVLITCIVTASWLGFRQFLVTDALRLSIATVAVSVPPAIAAWIAWKLRKRTEIGVRIADGWQMMAVACIAALAATITAIVPQAMGSASAATNTLSAGFHYLMAISMLTGLARWVRWFTPAATIGALLDLSAVGLLGYLMLWHTLSGSPLLGTTTATSIVDQINLLAYPTSDVLLLVAAIAVLSQIGRYELRGAEIMATFGVVGLVIADLRFIFAGTFTGNVIDPFVKVVSEAQLSIGLDTLWYVGFLGIAMGAAIRSRPNTDTEFRVPLVERSTTWELIWTMMPFTMLAVAMTAWEVMPLHTPTDRVAFLVLIALLISRGGLVAVSNLRRARTGDTDPLTGAFNHTYLQDIIPTLVQRAHRDERPLSLLTIDIDDFAAHNESYGYHVGDRLLREMAYVIRSCMSPSHLLFRPGGDEFAIAMPATDIEAARDVAVTLERTVATMNIGGLFAPSLTMGIAAVPDHTGDPYELIQLASGSLYFGKITGKHSITVYDPNSVTVMSADERVHLIEQHARLRTVIGLARALDTRDAYTARHSHNVARYSIAIASQLGWNAEQLELLRIAGLLHDVGKIGVRDATLLKTSSLTPEERTEMRSHPEMSAKVISGVAPDEVLPWVVSHHERWDGRGYPHGLAGQDIPMGARIIAVADTFDAMTSSRSYRAPMPVSWAVAEIGRCAGEQFDPVVARAFLQAVANGGIIVDTLADAEAAAVEAERSIPLIDTDAVGTIELEPEFTPLQDDGTDDTGAGWLIDAA